MFITERLLQSGIQNPVYLLDYLYLLHLNHILLKKYEGQLSVSECSSRLLVHEYGHTIQSLILGPLYLIVIGIPSTLWVFFGAKKRKDKQVAYGSFFTEGWANSLGEWVTGEKSIGNMVLD